MKRLKKSGMLLSFCLYSLKSLIDTTSSSTSNNKKRFFLHVDYFAKLESVSDSLALVGLYVGNDELIMCILTGLPAEHDALVVAILSRGVEMYVHEVHH